MPDTLDLSPWRSLPGIDQLMVTPSTPAFFMSGLLDKLMMIDGIDAAWIGRPDRDGQLCPEVFIAPDLAAIHDPAALVNVQSGPRSHSPAGRAWRSGSAQISSDIGDDESLTPWREDWQRLGFRVSAAIPLVGGGGVHRVLTLYSRTPDYFETHWPIKFLTDFGVVMGTAIETRLNEEALQRTKRLLETLFVGFEVLLDAANETKMLRTICKRLSETGLFISAAIGWGDDDGFFCYTIAAGRDAASIRKLRQPLDTTGPAKMLGTQAWQEGRMITAEHYGVQHRPLPSRQIAAWSDWKAAAAAPIRRAGTIFAVLFLVSGDSSVIDAETQRLISQLASNIGRALDEIDLKTALRAERETQSRMARHDKLTELPNRLAFEEMLPVSLAHAARHNLAIGIGILDLDNFKPVNDRFGHPTGDLVLRVLAARIRATLREVDFVARLGGDEFALIIEAMESPAQVSGFCARLDEVIRQPIALGNGHDIVMSASLGFTLFPADPTSADTMIRHADMALYRAKATKTSRPHNWAVYQAMTGVSPTQTHHRDLLGRDEVEVHFQPLISLGSRRVIAVEALVRLRDGDQLIPPGAFLPDFTATEREALLASVLRRGIICLRAITQLSPGIGLTINVDAEVLARGAVPGMISEALAGSGIAPERLVVELLESHEFPNTEIAVARMNALRDIGVSVALDDLGIEFSTLKRVQTLPISHIKVDRRFLADVMRMPNDLVFLAGYITMAGSLGLSLCVEGVETPDMLDALQILRAPIAQGFGIARPMPQPKLEAWLKGGNVIPPPGTPRTMLGAYALHVLWVRVFLFLPLEASLVGQLRRGSRLSLTRFITRNGLGKTALGRAYETLMATIDEPNLNIRRAAHESDQVRALLAAAVIAQVPVEGQKEAVS
ncbi:MAG: EAL domain-containing protein [Acidocella sp.]|nr:EAL domain-containing protein [Acidocella sp.]